MKRSLIRVVGQHCGVDMVALSAGVEVLIFICLQGHGSFSEYRYLFCRECCVLVLGGGGGSLLNPNMTLQWVPGLETFDSVNGFGIIEIKDWSELLDAVAILRTSKAWSKKEDEVCCTMPNARTEACMI
jgi:hypothetical protein